MIRSRRKFSSLWFDGHNLRNILPNENIKCIFSTFLQTNNHWNSNVELCIESISLRNIYWKCVDLLKKKPLIRRRKTEHKKSTHFLLTMRNIQIFDIDILLMVMINVLIVYVLFYGDSLFVVWIWLLKELCKYFWNCWIRISVIYQFFKNVLNTHFIISLGKLFWNYDNQINYNEHMTRENGMSYDHHSLFIRNSNRHSV